MPRRSGLLSQTTVLASTAFANDATVSPGSPLSRTNGMPRAASAASISFSPRSMNPNCRAPAPRNLVTRLNTTTTGTPFAAALSQA